MARLIVEACSCEPILGHGPGTVFVGVSVSRADDGKGVTGLKAENFRVSAPHELTGFFEPYKVGEVHEWKWEPSDVEVGCYIVHINKVSGFDLREAEHYVFGIQARTFGDPLFGRRPVIDQGQTVFDLICTTSMGS